MVANRHLNGKLHPVVATAGRHMLERETRERGSVLSSEDLPRAHSQCRAMPGSAFARDVR